MIKKTSIVFFIITLICTFSSVAFAYDSSSESLVQKVSFKMKEDSSMEDEIVRIDSQEETLILTELGLEKSQLTHEEIKAILTTGSATIWNKTYNAVYNIKESFSMTASLIDSGTNKPYTTVTINNNGITSATVIAYKGSIAGSQTIHSMNVPAGSSRSMIISRNDILNYGTLNGQGTNCILAYSISVYNINGKPISFNARAIRYY